MLHRLRDLAPGTPVMLAACEDCPDLPATVIEKWREACRGCGGDAYHVETQAGQRFIACVGSIRPVRVN